MTARDRRTLPDRSPTPRRFPSPDLPTEIIPVATAATVHAASAAPTAALGGTDDGEDSDGKFGLSLTQIVASTAAAVTAALIGSRLGVAGTLVGAALASIVSGVGAAIYSHSLLVTRRQMKRALQLVRPRDETTAATASVSGGEHAATRPPRAASPDDDLTELMPAVIPPAVRPPRARGKGRTLTAALAGVAAAGVIFAGALATVTLVETVKGAPLSGGDSGLSVLGGNGSSGTSTDPTRVTVTSPATSRAPSTTVTQTVTQSPTVSSQPAQQSTAPTTAPSSAGPTSGNAPTSADQSVSAAGSAVGQAATTAPTGP